MFYRPTRTNVKLYTNNNNIRDTKPDGSTKCSKREESWKEEKTNQKSYRSVMAAQFRCKTKKKRKSLENMTIRKI